MTYGWSTVLLVTQDTSCNHMLSLAMEFISIPAL